MFIKNTSLSIKMALITVLAGTVIWLVLNSIQTAQFTHFFKNQLQERFSKNAEDDRYRFDHAVKSVYRSVRLLSEYEPLKHYTDTIIDKPVPSSPVEYNRPPEWLPAISILRDMVPFHYALMIDSKQNVREIFKSTRAEIPRKLLRPTPHLLELSSQQTYLTLIDNVPYLLASSRIKSKHKNVPENYLMLATPVDSSFLIYTQGGTQRGNIVAVLDSDNERILVSSLPHIISPGMAAVNIRKSYLVTNTAFFDYGASDILIRFVSLTPTDEVQALTNTFIWRGIIAAIAFMVPFIMIMYRITHRIELLNKRIHIFARGMKLDIGDDIHGDQIDKLENRFIAMSEKIIEETGMLEHQAMHDNMTGLPNRALFNDRLDLALSDAHREQHMLAVMILDLDKFKEINDSLGHHIGDEVLKLVSARFSSTLRGTDTVARFGGDEFAIVLQNTNREQARQVATKLVEILRTPVQVLGHKLDVGTSIGIAIYPDDAADKHSLLQYADHAMYDAKRARTGYKFYDPETTGISHIKSL